MAKKITTIGGQALMEGIMMVGPQRTVAAFCSEEGQISTEEISVPRLTKLYPILGKPFIRGIFSLIDSFRLGYKALSLSADKLTGGEEEEELSGFDKWLSDHLGEKITGVIMAIASVLGIALAIALFFFLPTVLFNLLEAVAPGEISGWRSIFEGVIRIGIFVGYVVLIGMVPDIKRTFQYHGAEHKTIFCYENGGKRARAEALPPPVRHQLPHPHAGHRHHRGVLHPLLQPLLAHLHQAAVHPRHYERGLRGAKGLRPPRWVALPGGDRAGPVDAAPDCEGAG